MAQKPKNSAKVWQVVPGSVYDGDTIKVTDGSQEVKIRFCGIDAPEKKQPLGIEARDYLRSQIDNSGGKVRLKIVDTDHHNRKVAEVWANNELVNARMVVAGYAYHYAQYSGNCPNTDSLISTEEYARTNGLGVWADPNSVPPWEWRKSRK